MIINNTENANRYYQNINDLVDDYIDKWKIKPSNLKKYLSPNSDRFEKFLIRNKLNDVSGAKQILKDILDDRENMERDGVITFEKFQIFESDEFKILSMTECLYKGIEKATNQMEKVLADHFDTNLSDIDIIDPDKHIFKLNNWENKEWTVVIYSNEEINVILHNINEYLFTELSKKKIELNSNISIELSELINHDNFTTKIKNILNMESCKNIISNCLGDNFKFKTQINDHYIWIS